MERPLGPYGTISDQLPAIFDLDIEDDSQTTTTRSFSLAPTTPSEGSHGHISRDSEAFAVSQSGSRGSPLATPFTPASDSCQGSSKVVEESSKEQRAGQIASPSLVAQPQEVSYEDDQALDWDDDLDEDDGSIYGDTQEQAPWTQACELEDDLETRPVCVQLPQSTLVTPKSHYEPFDPGVPIMSERSAVTILLSLLETPADSDEDFWEIQLDEFAIYSDTQHYDVEMRPLHHLDADTKGGQFFFDGILNVGKERIFVKYVPIEAMPIGNYSSLQEHTTKGSIWLQSPYGKQKDIYYQLVKPADEYARFYYPFQWVADLSKHFVDFLKSMWEEKLRVGIHHFRSDFHAWIQGNHGNAPAVLQWLAQHPSNDFRTSVIANLSFLHKEAIGVLTERQAYVHPLWSEVMAFDQYKALPERASGPGGIPPTIVTPYIMQCFEHMPFGSQLKTVPFSALTEELRNMLVEQRSMEIPREIHQKSMNISATIQEKIRNIQPGDTISTHRDGEDSGTLWEREESRDSIDSDRWYALVQRVHMNPQTGRRSFDVTWYYRPVDTLCGLMRYPWNNEVFLSDHCSCNERVKIKEDEILNVHEVDFSGTVTSAAELFCRQTYVHAERKWISLEKDHLLCIHRRQSLPNTVYLSGDTVLVHLDRSGDTADPFEVISHLLRENRNLLSYTLRRLPRRGQVDPSSSPRPNELTYPTEDDVVMVTETDILGPCSVRFFRSCQNIPTPYDRDGVGNLFFITHELRVDGSIVPLSKPPSSLRQGFDPTYELPRLRGLDLFCGGGNFGRGLEDGGGVRMQWANDFNTKAIHTYMANTDPEDDIHPFLGSIDVLQRLAIEGHFSVSVPRIGEVDFISAGSPCPGFSRLTNDKTTVQQRKNQSLVAAFASFVDLYRPKYGLLENVPGIVEKKANRAQDVFSQLICAMVGLGYRTQFYFLDASSCGSPQRRSRVFLAFAAPGYELPKQPEQTHSHPPGTRALSVGRLPTGESMARRKMPSATPFKFATAETATADLPLIYDAKPDICVSHPDHRVSCGMTLSIRMQIYHVPTHPYAMNFSKAWFGHGKPRAGAGVLTKVEREHVYPPDKGGSISRVAPNSQAYGRQDPSKLLGTVTTKLSINDAKAGRAIHWREDRAISILEARRAQGFRDHEVILGNPRDQFKIVGNSVAREVSVALGLAFREAWATTLKRIGDKALPSPVDDAIAIDNKAVTTSPSVWPSMRPIEAIMIDDSRSSVESDESHTTGSLSLQADTPITLETSSSCRASPSSSSLGKRQTQISFLPERPRKTVRSKSSPLANKVVGAMPVLRSNVQNTMTGAARSSSLHHEVIIIDDD